MKKLRIIISMLCLLVAVVALVYQFKIDNLLPLLVAVLFISPIYWLCPSWFRVALIIPLGGSLLFLADARLFRHRIAVEMRVWTPGFNYPRIGPHFVSPSGKTTVYLVEGEEGYYWVYISAGGMFPLPGYYATVGDVHREDLIVKWSGPLFTFGHRQISYAYRETKHEAYNYVEWKSRAIMASRPARTLEDFSAYVTAQQAEK